MNRVERSALGPLVKSIIRHNKHPWWELKHEIWSSGSQVHYPRQSEYQIPVRLALDRLNVDSWQSLDEHWRKSNPGQEDDRAAMRRYYESVVIEEIVRRAHVAAYRTQEW